MNPLQTELRFLRPYLYCRTPKGSSVYRSFASTARCCGEVDVLFTPKEEPGESAAKPAEKPSAEGDRFHVNARTDSLRKAGVLKWPRVRGPGSRIQDIAKSLSTSKLKPGEAGEAQKDIRCVRGKVASVRSFGSGLTFLTLVDGHQSSLEVMIDAKHLRMSPWNSHDPPSSFHGFTRNVERGDYISIQAVPYHNKKGNMVMRCLFVPHIITPALAPLPTKLTDPEARTKNRHVDMLVNPDIKKALRTRAAILKCFRQWFAKNDFTEVSTPILVEKANGAVARPFLTNATEFPEKTLSLRVAPEIWLKRLVIGGMERVYEIGPAFRNEGLDGTHNPEFTTCEFYCAYTPLQTLMSDTQSLFESITAHVEKLATSDEDSARIAELKELTKTNFNKIEFIPGIEEAIGEELPDLKSRDAEAKLIKIFESRSLPLPSTPNLPRLLDKLATIFLEPQCEKATFITHHPAVMSPLAKSFECRTTKQLVSARAELFIQKREIANMYEEENSPITQRFKFVQQQKYKDEENEGVIDESYIEALEWGLPPTGGWGCGIDRIVMLYTGAARISDVLPFGNLRNVVNIGSGSSRRSVESLEREDVEQEVNEDVIQDMKAEAEQVKEEVKEEVKREL